MEQSPSLLVSFVLPLLLALVGVVSAVLVAAVPKLLERRGPKPQAPPVFDDDPPLDVEGRRDVTVLLDTVARLGEQLDDAEQRAERWRCRALACEQERR